MAGQDHLNILGSNAIPVNQNVVIELSQESIESIDQEVKEKFRILKFSPQLKFDAILSAISRLESKSFPNFFILIIGDENFELSASKTEDGAKKLKLDFENLKSILLDFCKNRPMILQLTSRDENVTKFFFKEESSEEFYDIKAAETEVFHNFSSFLRLYLSGVVDKFEELMVEKLPKVENSPLILRFLRTLELSEDFFKNLVLKCATKGTTSDLLAAIDGYIDSDGKLQGSEAKKLISSKINNTSILQSAIQLSNQKIIEFLVEKCANSIQKIPFRHQIDISTTALETKQFDVLCYLLESGDFPFPRYIAVGLSEPLRNIRFDHVSWDRAKFHNDVLDEDLPAIKRFFKLYPKVKFAYGPKNKPAIRTALDNKKFQSFFFLMEKLLQVLDVNVLKQFILKKQVFLAIIRTPMDIKVIQQFLNNIKDKTDSNFINEMVKMEIEDAETLFLNMIKSEQIQPLEEFFIHLNISHNFKELITREFLDYERNVLRIAFRWQNVESYQTFFELLLKTFKDREELKDLMIQEDTDENNFAHNLVTYGQSETIEFTFTKLKENFNAAQYSEILRSKGQFGRNLLQLAAYVTKDAKIHKVLWKVFPKNFTSAEEFSEILNEVDSEDKNVFQIVAALSTGRILERIIDELKKVTTNEEIRKILSAIGPKSKNLLQTAAQQNKSLEFHKSLWEIFEILFYFHESEVVDMTNHTDEDGLDVLQIAIKCNTLEIVDLTRSKIRRLHFLRRLKNHKINNSA